MAGQHDNCMVKFGKKGGSTPPSSTIRKGL
nr:MAG TPA: hypothetical protein [Caudoviricetes sp.]